MEIVVYGAEVQCASCVGAPSSRDTYEWIETAIKRMYEGRSFRFRYVDIFDVHIEEEDKALSEKIIEEDWFYPVITVNGVVAGEGNIQLRTVQKVIDEINLTSDRRIE